MTKLDGLVRVTQLSPARLSQFMPLLLAMLCAVAVPTFTVRPDGVVLKSITMALRTAAPPVVNSCAKSKEPRTPVRVRVGLPEIAHQRRGAAPPPARLGQGPPARPAPASGRSSRCGMSRDMGFPLNRDLAAVTPTRPDNIPRQVSPLEWLLPSTNERLESMT